MYKWWTVQEIAKITYQISADVMSDVSEMKQNAERITGFVKTFSSRKII